MIKTHNNNTKFIYRAQKDPTQSPNQSHEKSFQMQAISSSTS